MDTGSLLSSLGISHLTKLHQNLLVYTLLSPYKTSKQEYTEYVVTIPTSAAGPVVSAIPTPALKPLTAVAAVAVAAAAADNSSNVAQVLQRTRIMLQVCYIY